MTITPNQITLGTGPGQTKAASSRREKAWPALVDLALLRNRISRAPRVAGNYAAIFHFVDPITGFGNGRIMGGQEQRFFTLLHDILKQLKSALRIGRIQVAGRFIR